MRKLIKQVRDTVAQSLYAADMDRLIKLNAVPRPNYAYILLRAADLASRLGIPAISALEFGVAGGNGLIAMQAHAESIGKLTGVEIKVYGFDTGAGLPPPQGYRDLPYIWQEAHFRMDEAALRQRLGKAELVLGLVEDTVASFATTHNPPPVGAISFDLDYYSSTVAALGIFDLPADKRLPRIYNYFDDILSSNLGALNRRIGVPAAVEEHIASHPDHGLDPLVHLEFEYAPIRRWHRQIYVLSDFAHPRHDEYIIKTDRQLKLNG